MVRYLQCFQFGKKVKKKSDFDMVIMLGIWCGYNSEKQCFQIRKKGKNIHGFHMVSMLGICSGYNSEKNKHSVLLMKREAKGTLMQLVCTSVCF